MGSSEGPRNCGSLLSGPNKTILGVSSEGTKQFWGTKGAVDLDVGCIFKSFVLPVLSEL